MKGFREKCEKPQFWAFWAKMPHFGQFLAKMGKTVFFLKSVQKIFSRLQALINCKVLEKSNEGILRKMRKTSILGILSQKVQFSTLFLPTWAKQDFFQKALGTFFPPLQALTNCKVSEKVIFEQPRDTRMYARTYARTHTRESLGLQRLRRETKK